MLRTNRQCLCKPKIFTWQQPSDYYPSNLAAGFEQPQFRSIFIRCHVLRYWIEQRSVKVCISSVRGCLGTYQHRIRNISADKVCYRGRCCTRVYRAPRLWVWRCSGTGTNKNLWSRKKSHLHIMMVCNNIVRFVFMFCIKHGYSVVDIVMMLSLWRYVGVLYIYGVFNFQILKWTN